MNITRVAACLCVCFIATVLHADNARFDLAGPKIDVRVTRGNATLPIAEVPNLRPGDKIWVKADLPATQSNHLLLIVAFLRGTTNEPPDSWFTEIDTWEKKTVEGTTVTVPSEAEQALLFIAPETGGDFKTLRSAVKGRPGLFIRADADLNEASFEQQRIEHYLAAIRNVPQDDQKAIQDRSAKLAATLSLKPNADCFKQPIDQQVNCLTQSSAPVLLNDGHGQSIAEALSTGPSSDFINAASYTQPAGAGLYSPYVGAIVDLVHLVSLMRTAQYQYIPAIGFPQGSTLNLKLNAPPSFHNPKSVIVIGLPAIQDAKLPPLRPHDPNQVACLLHSKMTLRLEGAPLVFSTSFAHDLVLHLNRTGEPTDIPLVADAFEGGLVVKQVQPERRLDDVNLHNRNTPAQNPEVKIGSATDLTITGTVRGYWGFDSFEGPTLTIQQIDGKNWKVVSDSQIIAGEDTHVTLQGEGTACVQHIAVTNGKERDVEVPFKAATGENGKIAANKLDLDVSLKKMQPGGYSLAIQQYGDSNQDKVPLTAYTGDLHFDDVKIHAGDNTAMLRGRGLQNVDSVQIGNLSFVPTRDGSSNESVRLQADRRVSPDSGSEATVNLKDGRTMKVKITVEAARPRLDLISFKATPSQQNGAIPISLGGKDDISIHSKLTFVVHTAEIFPRTQTIEVATVSGSAHASLSLQANDLILQDEHTVVGTIDPLKAFGQSAFGKLQMRPVAEDGTVGDWTPLGILVRTPDITAIHCSADSPNCTIDGSNFFLVQCFSATSDFSKPTEVPSGFADNTLNVPVPADGTTLYIKLRDDPEAAATVTLPAPVQNRAASASQ